MSDSLAQNPYAAPASNLQEPTLNSQVPSIAEALQRGYDFSIGALISEAWQRTKGAKGIIIGGVLIYYVAILVISTILGVVFAFAGLGASDGGATLVIGQLLVGIIGSALTYPLLAGIMMTGIRRAADQPITINQMFSHFGLALPLIVTALIMMVLIYVGLLLLVIPGIYLSVAYMLAIPLVVERGLSPWQALETSRKAISQHWFKVFGLCLLLGLIIGVSAIPLGIGLIWSLPLFAISMGALYRTIFGVLPAAK